jgi:hypothetical protein
MLTLLVTWQSEQLTWVLDFKLTVDRALIWCYYIH